MATQQVGWRLRPARVQVIDSPVGRGVAAEQKIRKGRVFGEVLGELISDPDYGSDYCVRLDRGRSLEPAAPYRFLNHGCEPNAELFYCAEQGEAGRVTRLYVQALRDIRRGEEILIDYGWSADVAIPCRCGSEACRGWVVSVDELAAVLREQRKAARKSRKPNAESRE